MKCLLLHLHQSVSQAWQELTIHSYPVLLWICLEIVATRCGFTFVIAIRNMHTTKSNSKLVCFRMVRKLDGLICNWLMYPINVLHKMPKLVCVSLAWIAQMCFFCYATKAIWIRCVQVLEEHMFVAIHFPNFPSSWLIDSITHCEAVWARFPNNGFKSSPIMGC